MDLQTVGLSNDDDLVLLWSARSALFDVWCSWNSTLSHASFGGCRPPDRAFLSHVLLLRVPSTRYGRILTLCPVDFVTAHPENISFVGLCGCPVPCSCRFLLLQSVTKEGDGTLTLTLENGEVLGGFDQVLVAAGREPILDTLGLDSAGVKTDKGYITVRN